eukprot:892526_1
MNTSIVTGTLMWPNFTIVFVESMSGAEIIVSGNDVFGNYDGIGFNIMDINISNWNISIETPSPTIVTTYIMNETYVLSTFVTSNSKSTDKLSEKTKKGLDIIPSFVWLIIICLLIVVIIVLA